MSLGDLFYVPEYSTNYDSSLSEWLKQGNYGGFTDTTSSDVGSGYTAYTPQWNPFTTLASAGNGVQFNLSGDSFTQDNFDDFLRQRYGIGSNITHDQLQSFFNSPQGREFMTTKAGGWKEDWQSFAQTVAKAVAMYFGGPAAVAGSIAAGGATTAGASPAASTAIGALVGAGAGITGAGQGATSAGTTSGFGDAGYSGSASGSIQGAGGGGGGFGGGLGSDTGSFDQSGSQGVFDSSGNPLYQNSGGTQEPGMWDWLDSMDSGDNLDFGDWGVDDGSSSAGTVSNSSNDTGAFDQFGSDTGPDSNTTIFGGTDSNPFGNMSLTDIISKYGEKGLSLVKSLLAKSGSGGAATSTGGGILGNILSDPLGAAFDSTPFLLALNEANKQSGDLNDILSGINGTAYTKAVLDPYDTDTGTGRASLQNDMALRGIAGSSFGNTQLNNYDYTRALGRSDMATKAQLAAAQLQGSLVNTRNTNRNLLLGAGLNASAKLFAPQQDPFNLKALLGA